MECISLDVEAIHLGVGYFDALLVKGFVKFALHLQASFRRRRTDQLDDGHTA